MSPNKPGDDWKPLLDELARRTELAESMGGEERLARQRRKGRLNARERVARLCDENTFTEYGALGAGADPAGREPVAADALVGGVGDVDGRATVVIAEDFTVRGGSIGHVNSAKRLRLTQLALDRCMPVIVLLDGAGERASNALERYPFSSTDLQVLADLQGKVPIVTAVLGTSAGHGALTGLFADFIVMSQGAAIFAAGPPLVRAALGIDVTPEELGGARLHTADSGVAHNLAADEEEALALVRKYLTFTNPRFEAVSADGADTGARRLEKILETIPVNPGRPYDVHDVLTEVFDAGTVCEVQPAFGTSIVAAFARLGARAVFVVANQPLVAAGAITADAADKAAHFLRVAASYELPVVFLADNPGVMAGPDAERAGTLRAAARMYAAQRALRGPKLHVTLRKAFGFGSSLMAMNPLDRQTVTLALPGISLGGVPAAGGAEAAKATDDERARLAGLQSGAWSAADNASYDRVIDPRDLRNELLRALAAGR